MIAVRYLDERVATAGQLQPGDIRDVAGMGFRVIVNNRPDGEAWFGQPSSRKIHAAAAAAGLQSHYLPIVLSTLGNDEISRFHGAVRAADGPVLAYCASGFRCALLWVLAEAALGGATVDDLMQRAAGAGHDLSRSRDLIERILLNSGTVSGIRPFRP